MLPNITNNGRYFSTKQISLQPLKLIDLRQDDQNIASGTRKYRQNVPDSYLVTIIAKHNIYAKYGRTGRERILRKPLKL